MDSTRIDKYLWSIRVYKTRNEATEACKGNKVQVNGVNAKPSREVHAGDMLAVRKGMVQMSFKVIQVADKRMGASLVPEFAENLTPESELAKLHAPVQTFFVRRERGSGRPTKKERRELDALWDEFSTEDI